MAPRASHGWGPADRRFQVKVDAKRAELGLSSSEISSWMVAWRAHDVEPESQWFDSLEAAKVVFAEKQPDFSVRLYDEANHLLEREGHSLGPASMDVHHSEKSQLRRFTVYCQEQVWQFLEELGQRPAVILTVQRLAETENGHLALTCAALSGKEETLIIEVDDISAVQLETLTVHADEQAGRRVGIVMPDGRLLQECESAEILAMLPSSHAKLLPHECESSVPSSSTNPLSQECGSAKVCSMLSSSHVQPLAGGST